tara:strand:- start:4289 stop:5233 length:945 start_codon:yes stop_codon:yes gene_type:complete
MKVIDRQKFNQTGSEEKTMQTVCLGCPFQNEQASPDSDHKSFCSANRLSAIEQNGGEVYAIKDSTEEKYYTAINKRICNMMRNQDWVEINTKNGYKQNELVSLARKEVRVRCDFIIYCGPCPEIKNETDDRIKRQKIKRKINEVAITMKSIDSGLVEPAHIYAINNSGIGPYDFINYLRIECESLGVKSKWNMEHISGSSVKEMSEEEACASSFNAAIKSSASNYFCFFISGDVVPENYLSDIDNQINDKMQKILVLIPDNNKRSGTFIQRMCEKQISQSPEPGGFLEKIKKEAEKQKCQSLIKSLSSVVKNIS